MDSLPEDIQGTITKTDIAQIRKNIVELIRATTEFPCVYATNEDSKNNLDAESEALEKISSELRARNFKCFIKFQLNSYDKTGEAIGVYCLFIYRS